MYLASLQIAVLTWSGPAGCHARVFAAETRADCKLNIATSAQSTCPAFASPSNGDPLCDRRCILSAQRGSVLRDDVSCRQHLMHALLECPTACVRIRVRESCATCVCARARSCARQSGSDASRGGTVGHREHKGPWQTVGHREHKGPWQPSGSLGGNDYG